MEIEADSRAAERGRARARPASPYRAPELPGCRPMPLKREDLDAYEGRFEFWDAATETAWVVREPTSAAHEHPSQRLSALGEVIAAVRGSPIECFGTMDLELRGEHGERWRILQADQSLYLHPARSRLPHETGMVVGEHDFPDMVLEVDHTTSGHGSKARGAERDLFVGIPDDDAEEAPGRRVQAAPRKAPRSSRSGGTARRRQRRGIVEEPV